jgi:hypothetical protein
VSTVRIADAVDPYQARNDARQILSDARYHKSPAPRPLRGPLSWLGDRLHGIGNWIGDRLAVIPGVVWIAIAVGIVTAIIVRVVVVNNRRRISSAHDRMRGADAPKAEDPNALEREADAAERDGDLDRALRLRFRAGLLRLGDRGAIAYRPSVTTGEVRRVLGSQTFNELARAFEHVAYGGEAAAPPDLENARREWPRVLDEAGRR